MVNINVAVLAETDYVRKYMLKVCKKLKVSPLVLKWTVVDKWEQEDIERDLAELNSANIDVLLVESLANGWFNKKFHSADFVLARHYGEHAHLSSPLSYSPGCKK
jgi:hypothetical protein